MSWIDVYLKRAVVMLAVLLVLILASAALYTVFSRTVSEPDDQATVDPAPAGRAYRGQRLEIDDLEFPLSVGCLPGVESKEVYVVVIENVGRTAADYLVAADLVDDGGERVEALATIADLAPGEEREVVLVADDQLGDISDCVITAIQGERRVLLTNS